MTELRVPVLRFPSEDACRRAMDVLGEQQFEVTGESATEISVRPWSDLGDAQALLDAEGIPGERSEKAVARLGPGSYAG